ncbi:MAG TPA: DUF4296 domain-containing protein [Ferruginibacter sp.]|nr:DUF4296 domain-containing protein [Ferruginibacter sp.]HMP21663.1 DUF4296 domain-containing protein [Ferruginibacter sp.]
MIRQLFILITAGLFLYACTSKGNGKLLGINKMKEVMWDVLQADVFVDNFVKIDTTKNAADESVKLLQQVFALHKIQKEDYAFTYEYYRNNPDKMKVLMDSVSAYAETKRRDMIMQRYEKQAAPAAH